MNSRNSGKSLENVGELFKNKENKLLAALNKQIMFDSLSDFRSSNKNKKLRKLLLDVTLFTIVISNGKMV